MDATDLLTALESNAADTAGLEAALQQALGEGVQGLDAFLAQVVPLLGKGDAAEAVLKVLDAAFRKNRDSDVGRTLGWHAGVLAWRVLGDLVRAEVYMRALGDGGEHAAEWQDFYCKFYASRGNWLRLEQFMTEVATRTGMPAVEMKRALARAAHEVGNAAKEMSYWQGVAQAAPMDPEASQELERLYTQLERWSSLADLLKERMKSVPDAAGKVALLSRMLEIFRDKMKVESKVLQTYQMILEVDPGNLDAIDALLERYEAASRWTDYAKVLQRKVDCIQQAYEAAEGEERAGLLGRLIALREKQAELNETRIPNAMEAQKAYERILELAPDRRDVIEKLKHLYETRRDFDSLIRIRRAEADRLEDPKARAAVLVDLAVMATERLRKIPVAIELWEMVLAIDDAHQDALRNLETLYEREKNVEKLCEVLRRRIDLAEAAGRTAEQVQLLEKLAGIYGAKLSDSAAALETWKRILSVQRTHDRARRELRQRFLAEHRWDDLDWFLREFGTVEELARTLESQLGQVTDPGSKRALLYKLAAMWRDELNTPRNAIKDLEAVLALFPEDMRAASELIALYRSIGDWRRLPHVYEIVIGQVEDRAERLRLMVEAAEVQERQLSNPEAAFFWYIAAFKEDMLDDRLREEAERLAGPSRNWDTYVAVLEQAASLMPDDARRISTWLRVGQIHYGQLHAPAAALEAFKQVLALDGENREAITALETIYREQGDFASLVDILRRRLDLERRKEERKAIRFDLAAILYGKLHRVDEAFMTYVDILADEPDETRAYDELSDLLVAERRFEDLLKVLVNQVEIYSALPGIPDEVMADLHCRIGLLTCALHEPSDAVIKAYRKALSFVPLHAHTLELLAGLLGVPEVRLDAVALLAGPYETLGRFTDLADLVEIELMDRGDSTDTVALLWRLHGLYGDRARDDHKLFRTLSRILAVTPGDEFAWDQMEQVAATLSAWRDLADRFEEAAEKLGDEAQVKLRLRLARVYWDRLRNPDAAKRTYRAVLDLDPANKDALDALEAIYEGELDHPQRLWVYQRQYDVSPFTGEKIAYAFKIAGVLADNLGDLPGAVEAVRRILDMDPEYESAWRLLDSLYTRGERWEDLAGVLTERVRLAEREREALGPGEEGRSAEILRDVVGLLLRLAEVREFRLGDQPGAVEVFRSILERDPACEEAVVQLERLFRDSPVRVMVAPILLGPYQARRDRDKLVEVYDVLAEAADSIDERLAHYDTIARLYEEAPAELELAFRYRARAFRAAPERAELVEELLRVGGALGSPREAVLVLVDKVAEIEDPFRRRETHRTIARVCRDAGIERDLSKRHYREVLEAEPDDSDALDALIALHGEDDEVEPLVALVLRKADLVQAPGERAALLLDAGDLYAHRLGRPEEAIGAYRGVLDIEPGNVRAIEALEVLYGRAEKWDELIEVLGRKAEFAESPAARVAALKKKGLIQHERKGDTTEAIATFNEVLGIDPQDVEALRTLDRLYSATEDWTSLYGTLERLYSLLSGDDQLTVHYRMGRLLERELGDPVRAVETYSRILDAHPDNRDAVDALEGMVRGGDAAEEAFRVLAPTLSDRGEWPRLYAVYDAVTEREDDIARKVTNLLTMGEIAEQRMGEPLRAFECYGRAFSADPLAHEALDKLESLAEAHGLWDGVPDLLVGAAATIEGTPDALRLRLHAGRVQRDRLRDLPAAAATFEAIAGDYPDNRDALSALDALYVEMDRPADLARVLKAEIDAAADAEEKVAFLLRLATVSETRLDSTGVALDARREVLYLRPAHAEAVRELRRMFDQGLHKAEILELLEPIYRDQAAWADLAAIYESVIPAVADPGERKLVLLKLGETWLDRLGDKTTAIGWLGKALELDPGDDALLARVEGLSEEAGAWTLLHDVLLAAASAAGEEGDRRVYLWHKAADCARDRIGDLKEAERINGWILDVDATDRQALASLDAMYEAQGRWDDLLGVLFRECEASTFDDERIGFYMRAAAIQRDRLQDLDGAVESFQAVLKMDDRHRGALEALAELHDVREEHQQLFDVLATLADIAESGLARAGLLRRMARLAEARLGKADAALELWDEVSRIEPEDVESLRELERLHAARGDWNAFVDTCEREIPLVRSEDTGRVVDLLRQVAKAAEEKLEDAYQAQQAWRRILEVAPDDLAAMQALRRLYREGGDLEGLSGILERLAATGAIKGAELQALLEEHARLLTDELPRLDVAIQKWNLVLEMQPEHAEALETLDRLYEDTGRIEECVAILKRRARLERDDGRRAELLARAADLQADRLHDLNAATATLEEVLSFAAANLEVSERLQVLYTRLENWDGLASVLLRRDAVLQDADARVANFAELARVYEDRKGDREAAFLILVKAADVSPGDEMVLADLWRLCSALGNWGDYVDMLSDVVDRMPEALMQEHMLRFGEVLWKRAGRGADAIQWFERVAAKWEENEPALVALTDLYAENGRPEQLVKALDRRVELTQDYLEKVQLELRAGRVLEEEIGDGDRALAAYRRVLEFDETCLEALRALARLHEARKEWEDLLKVLSQIASLVPAEEVPTRMRMGEILEQQVKDPARAIAAYKEVVSIDPRQAAALDRLQALYADQNDFPGLAEVFERSLDMCSVDADRIALCERLGMLWEEALGDKRKALEYYQRWLDMDPADDVPFETCARLMGELEEWNDLVNLLEARVSRSSDARVKVATLRRVAEVYEKRMGDINAAASVHQRVLDVDPSEVESYSELARLFGQMEAWEEVVTTIMRWKEHVDSDHEVVELLLRAATIVKERLENPDRALKLLGDVRRLEPANEAAAEKMRLIHAELEEWEKVAEVWLDQEAHAPDDERRAAMRAAAADVYMNRLKDRPRAIQHYEKALAMNPQLRDVALSLARAYVATEKWEKAEPLLDMLLAYPEVANDPARAAEIHFQIGLCAERLLDHDRAFREYTTALKARPEHAGTVLGLARLYQRRQLWQLAKDHYLKVVDSEDISEADRAAAHFALGEVSVEMGELDDAIPYLSQVPETSPNYPRALAIMIQIAEKKGDWAGVVQYKQALLATKRDPFERFAIMIEIGDIYRTRMRNFYGATQAYKEALQIKPGERAVLLRLFELYLDSGAIEDALYQLEQLAQAEESPEKRALHYVRMAALYQEKLGDDGRAIEYLNLALDSDPDRLEAFRAIDEILTVKKDWEAQAENYRRMLERLRGRSNPELEYRLYSNLGEIYRSRMKQPDYAIAAYSAAAKLKPEERRTHEILAQLYEMGGDQLDRAVEEHRAIVATAPMSPDVAPSYKAMRRLFMQMKEFDKAFVTAGVLVALGQADQAEVEFFEGNLEPGLPWFKGTIDALRWESHLMSKSENTTLGRILQALYQGLGSELGAKDLRDIGLRKKDELDLEQKLLFVNVYKAVAKALGPLPHRVYRDPTPSGLRVEFLSPPAFIAGSDMLTGHEEREAAFLIGRQLSYLHPMHFLAAVKNRSELMVYIAAVLKFCKPETPITTGAEFISEVVRLIERRMPQQQKNLLAKLVDDLAARSPGLDFQALFDDYFRSIERTALRAGTLVCGNVDVVLNVVKAEDQSFSGLPQRERLEEVIRFAVSEDHFVLRRALGVAVEGTGA